MAIKIVTSNNPQYSRDIRFNGMDTDQNYNFESIRSTFLDIEFNESPFFSAFKMWKKNKIIRIYLCIYDAYVIYIQI
jgi:hypothetical protein